MDYAKCSSLYGDNGILKGLGKSKAYEHMLVDICIYLCVCFFCFFWLILRKSCDEILSILVQLLLMFQYTASAVTSLRPNVKLDSKIYFCQIMYQTQYTFCSISISFPNCFNVGHFDFEIGMEMHPFSSCTNPVGTGTCENLPISHQKWSSAGSQSFLCPEGTVQLFTYNMIIYL